MPKALHRILGIVLAAVFAFTMLGAGDETTRLDHIGHQLVCQCGCGQILSECNHVNCPVSGPMLTELRTQIALGSPDKAILDSFMAKYGPIVLASPMRGGFDNVAWIAPWILAAGGLLVIVFVLRYWYSRHHQLAHSNELPGPASDATRNRIRQETTDDID
ncbi:cytochrome c-type biogenesis protein CcmH [Bryocella elongata]|uniref:Cytochrome c-type biogenesis protein n=1 Tax=Bryocella elongata TaxID=863522 RepID=A0A1H5UFQ2_9BACT|nr:cytochrome c-type biogenesis protein CcmH [Bryocella elongata]SEF73895.1 cytochrome c-type biogenesis protein CcmH [Bryocella elongata]